MFFLRFKIGYTLLSFQLWELCHVSFFRFQFVISGVSNSISMCADIKIHVSFFYIKVYRIAWSLILTWTTLLPSIIKLTDLLAVKNYPCIHNFLDPEKQISIFSSKLKNNHIHNKTSTRDTAQRGKAAGVSSHFEHRNSMAFYEMPALKRHGLSSLPGQHALSA